MALSKQNSTANIPTSTVVVRKKALFAIIGIFFWQMMEKEQKEEELALRPYKRNTTGICS